MREEVALTGREKVGLAIMGGVLAVLFASSFKLLAAWLRYWGGP